MSQSSVSIKISSFVGSDMTHMGDLLGKLPNIDTAGVTGAVTSVCALHGIGLLRERSHGYSPNGRRNHHKKTSGKHSRDGRSQRKLSGHNHAFERDCL